MSDLSELIYAINERRPCIERYESYFDGTASVTFVGEALQDEFGDQLEHMFVNRCAPIIETTLDRLVIQGFEDVDGGDHDQKANDLWRQYRMGRIARTVHHDALVAGDGWVLAWPETDGLKIVPQEPTDIAVLWNADDPNVIDVGAKVWRLRDGTWRLNLYYADRLEKYITAGPHAVPPDSDNAWTQHQDQGDPASSISHQMGRVPLFHFAVNNRAGTYGHSDLAAIIPLQDRLNLTIANQAVAEEFQSFRQRWATGIQAVIDPDTGEYVHPFTSGADRLWIAGDNATFGEFSAADLAQFEKVIEGHEVRIARTARIPMHYLIQTGTPESGESRKVAEAPFVSKVKARHNAFGDTWADFSVFVLSLAGTPEANLETVWESPESRDEQGELERALLKQNLGVSRPQTLREIGYEDTEIEAFAIEQDASDAELGEAFARTFNGL